MRLIETVLALLILILAFVAPRLGSSWFDRLESVFRNVGKRRGLLLVGISALMIRAGLLPVLPKPKPLIGDEFGYLLQADTFAQGRMTNPTHPMWEHFETFNVLQKPTYQCFMQPAQGLVLALGEVVFGHPFWGVWLSVGVMCASICWMLQGWLPPGWALVGGLLAVLRFGCFSYWADSYMGGAIAAIGGALVLGALPRIRHSPKALDAVLMGLGCALLAASRPYEGLVFSVPIGVALVAWMVSKNAPRARVLIRSVIAPAGVVFVVSAATLAFYFYRVTGNLLVMPYAVHQQTYAVAPYFIWQSLRTAPVYHYAAIRDAYANLYVDIYHFSRSPLGMLIKPYWLWTFFLGPALTMPVLFAIATLPVGFSWSNISRKTRFLLLLLAICLVGLILETYYGAHYAAPMTGLLLLLVLISMRGLRQWKWRTRPVGMFVSRMVPVLCVITFALRVMAGPLDIPLARSPIPAWYEARLNDFGRAKIASELNQLPGKQLVIVHYGPGHPFVKEWVFNNADIDNAKVVWAHEMDPAADEELIKYFRGRRTWLLEADDNPPQLRAWSDGNSNGSKPSLVGQHGY